MGNYIRNAWASFSDIFNFKDEDAKGRSIQLSAQLLTTFYNIFITGIFQTGFLSMYGMSITDAGILTFVPYLGNLFSAFSSKILERFQKRKWLLLSAKVIYFALYCVATTAMPQFVHDPRARLICFTAILFTASSFYALFAPGFTVWFYGFYPKNSERRTTFLVFLETFTSVLSSVILLLSGFMTDALEGSPYQNQLILGFRYFAFLLVLIEVFIQSRAKEYPYPKVESAKIRDVFTLPFKYKKFMLCMILMFVWSFAGNLNNGLWAYHLLNHLDFSYALINATSVMGTVLLIFFSKPWKKIIRRYSWIKTFGIACLLFVPTEVLFFFMTPERTYMYLPVVAMQSIVSIGLTFAYANVLYMNLPEENSTAHIAFNTFGSNIFAFLGMMTGTWISSISGDSTIPLFGMEVYSVQFTCLARAILLAMIGIILIVKWKSFTKQENIDEVESFKRKSK